MFKAIENYLKNENQSEITATAYAAVMDEYKVELFTDGTYRLLWDSQIGNLYESKGVIVPIWVPLESEVDDATVWDSDEKDAGGDVDWDELVSFHLDEGNIRQHLIDAIEEAEEMVA